jgi:prevent-host-death family protein
MPEVGIRQLRNHLSEYLRLVSDGDEITVTDHGRAVARLIPVDQPRLLDRLIADGVITPAGSREKTLPRRSKATAPVSPLVVDQRR